MKRSILLLATLGALFLGASPASAEFGLKDLEFTIGDGIGSPQSGSHPESITTAFGVNTVPVTGGELPEEDVRNLEVELPVGLIGSQTAVGQCTAVQFNTRVLGRPACPDSTAVGYVGSHVSLNPEPVGELSVYAPVYNLEPSPGSAAKLGFVVLEVPLVIEIGVDQSWPYNLVARFEEVPQAVYVLGAQLTVWGDPLDPSHDEWRGNCIGDPALPTSGPVSLGSCPAEDPLSDQPFLTLPRACEGEMETSFAANSWKENGPLTEPQTALSPGTVECDTLDFDPDADAQMTSGSAASPSGIRVDLNVPDEGLTTDARAGSDIRKVEVTLPEGVTVNPSAADGQEACSEAEYEAATLTEVGCPEASKLGTVSVETPLLGKDLGGEVFLAAQGANPFGSLLAFYIVIRDKQNGILIKQPGRVDLDPVTGRLRTTVEGIPQIPFSRLTVRFREGPRAPLSTPPRCGTYETQAVFTPWSGGDPVSSTSSFVVGSGPGGGPCPPSPTALSPAFEAGTDNNLAGAYSSLLLRVVRFDGEQDLTRLSAVLPDGILPKLAGVPSCSEAAITLARSRSGREEIAAPSCPEASRIGRVLGGAGVGTALTYVPGSLYLAGPYNGAPMSAVAIVPAVAGPFDVGTVVVRVGLTLNPVTHLGEVVSFASDPIPRILQGIPLSLRDLRVFVDRPEFIRNPTSCDEQTIGATAFGTDATAPLTARFQAASCAALGFKPKLILRFKGETKRVGHPSVRAELIPRSADANLRNVAAFLPKTTFVDAANVPGVCTRAEFAEDACPKESIIGRARAFTPLLDEPLEGPVYFRSNGDERELPDIVADLRGQFRVTLVGFVDTRHERIRTRFVDIPDAPVDKFVLRLYGGKRGLVQNSADLCRHRGRAILNLAAKNGRVEQLKDRVKVRCNKRRNASKRHSRAG